MTAPEDLFVLTNDRIISTITTLQSKLHDIDSDALHHRNRSEKLKNQITYLRTLYIDSLSTRWNARLDAMIGQFESTFKGDDEGAKKWASEVDRLYAMSGESRPIPTVASMDVLRTRCYEFAALFDGAEFDAWNEPRQRLKREAQSVITALVPLAADQRLRDEGRARWVDKKANAEHEIEALRSLRTVYSIVREICEAMEVKMVESMRRASALEAQLPAVEEEIRMCEDELETRRNIYG